MAKEQAQANQAVQGRAQELRQEAPSKSNLNASERMRSAVERQAACIHERNQMRDGDNARYADARKQAERNAERLERQRRGE